MGASGTPIDSTAAGLGVSETYIALKNFSRIQLSSTIPTQLPNCPCGYVEISNPIGNDTIFVGGLDGSGDTPYLDENYPGQARGTAVYGGNTKQFRVANSNLLQVIANRDGDIIQIMPMLSEQDFQTPTNDPPPNPAYVGPLVVVSTNPVNGATNILQNTVAKMLFSRSMNPVFITSTNLTVSPTASVIKIYLDPNNAAQIDIDPQGANLLSNTLYTITAGTTLQDTLGKTLASPYSFSFTTTTTAPPPVPPTVSSTTPMNNATGIATNTVITIIMSEAIQPATVTSTNVFLQDPNSTLVPASLSVASDSRTITLTPTSLLLQASKYTLTVQNLKDLAGDVMTAPYTSIFNTTAPSFTQFYNSSGSTVVALASSSGNGTNYFGIGERAINSSSKLIGHIPRKVVCSLAGSQSVPPTAGTVYCAQVNSSFSIVHTLGSISAQSSLTTTPTTIVFEDASNTSPMAVGDWVGVYVNNTIFGTINAYKSSATTFDGANSETSLFPLSGNPQFSQDITDWAATFYE